MKWELEVLEDAVRDLEVAYRWYDGQKQGVPFGRSAPLGVRGE